MLDLISRSGAVIVKPGAAASSSGGGGGGLFTLDPEKVASATAPLTTDFPPDLIPPIVIDSSSCSASSPPPTIPPSVSSVGVTSKPGAGTKVVEQSEGFTAGNAGDVVSLLNTVCQQKGAGFPQLNFTDPYSPGVA